MQASYEEFTSPENYALAWERVRYFDRPDSKDWFALYRLNPDPKITEAIIPFFAQKPWFSEVIALYLSKGKLQKKSVEFFQNIISEHDVYDHVVAVAIKLLLQQGISMRNHQDLFRRWVLNENRHWPLVEAAAQALGESNEAFRFWYIARVLIPGADYAKILRSNSPSSGKCYGY